MSLRVDLLDPPAYSPPYDHALASALSAQGVQVRLLTSPFAYGEVPAPDGYRREEIFYGRARGAAGSKLRTGTKLAVHVQDMNRYRRNADADIVHVEWLTVPGIDLRLLPKLPTVLTVHDPLSRGPLPSPAPDLSRIDAVIVHSEYARSVVLAQHALDPQQVHVIPHGALGEVDRSHPETEPAVDPGTPDPDVPNPAAVNPDVAATTVDPRPAVPATLPPELAETDLPVVLCFGLIRPYKGIATLLKAWAGVSDAQLWIVGRPMMDVSEFTADLPAGVTFVPRYVTAQEEEALYRRADLVALPYERSSRFGFSGVLATALGYGKAIVVSDVGGLAEVTEFGAARSVPPGDPDALAAAIQQLVDDHIAREDLAAAAAAAAAGPYSWDAAARATLALYETIRR